MLPYMDPQPEYRQSRFVTALKVLAVVFTCWVMFNLLVWAGNQHG
jgi:hypothetical protein